jgi:hypothetical protein
MDNVLIILTCTVNVNYNKFYLFQTDPNERINCYLKSIKQWLEKTNLKICVVENSGYTFPELNEYREKYSNRFEIISYVENDLPIEKLSIIGTHSKGGSEICAINFAYENTIFRKTTDFIIKITCRYFIEELEQFLLENNLSYRSKGGIGIFNSDNILGLRQFTPGKCEIIGSHVKAFPIIFDPLMCNIDNLYNQHIESIYMNRLQIFNAQNIVICKQFTIEPTQMGGINNIVTEL